MSTVGDIRSTVGDIRSTVGDILSTVVGYSVPWGNHDARGAGFSLVWGIGGTPMSSMSPLITAVSPHKILNCPPSLLIMTKIFLDIFSIFA